jgi:hypothetical protein
MSEQLNNVLWMAEEIDFELPAERQTDAERAIATFIESAGGTALRHLIYPASR